MTGYLQGSSEWLEMRRNHIGASDTPIILGLSKWKSPYQLWMQKLGLVEDDIKTPQMQRGIDLEPEARELFNDLMGLDLFPYVAFSDEYNFMMASLDGTDSAKKERKHILEIKCPGREDHLKAINGVIPDHYMPQLQKQMIVTNLSSCFYMSYVTKNDYKIISVNKDRDYCKKIIDKECEFWYYIQNFVPPPLTNKDFIIKNDDKWNQSAEAWKNLNLMKEYHKSRLKLIEDEEELIKENLINMSNGINCVGGGLKLNKIVRKGNIDYKSVPVETQKELEKYRNKPIEYWKFSND